MASGHGVSKPDKANHPSRQVGAEAWTSYVDVGASLNQQGARAREAFYPGVATQHFSAADAVRAHMDSLAPNSGQPKVGDISAVTGMGTRAIAAAQSHSGDVALSERMPNTARRMYKYAANAYGDDVPSRTKLGLRSTEGQRGD